jgi:TRAP-type C4-dicarboxylate transport system permease small subunit
MLEGLDHLEEWLITLLIGAATLIIFVAVAHRYASGVTIPMSEMTVSVWPWLPTMPIFLVIVTHRPPLSIWLPKVLGMM